MNDISTFNDVVVEPDSYILCDIDDTVLDYGDPIAEYWKVKPHDPMYNIWHELVCSIEPVLTDIYFERFVRTCIHNKCEVYFITHRNTSFNDITNKHMNEKGLGHIPIHFLNGTSKGDYIRRNFTGKNKIFIDDSKHNVEDVLYKNSDCTCYLFKKKPT